MGTPIAERRKIPFKMLQEIRDLLNARVSATMETAKRIFEKRILNAKPVTHEGLARKSARAGELSSLTKLAKGRTKSDFVAIVKGKKTRAEETLDVIAEGLDDLRSVEWVKTYKLHRSAGLSMQESDRKAEEDKAFVVAQRELDKALSKRAETGSTYDKLRSEAKEVIGAVHPTNEELEHVWRGANEK